MKTALNILSRNRNATSIELDNLYCTQQPHRKLTELDPLLEELELHTKMKSLSLTNNKLSLLPLNLSALKALQRLSLKNNPLADISLVAESLASLPSLKELSLNIRTGEEAQIIINLLPHLEVLNGERIDSTTDGEDLEQEEGESDKIQGIPVMQDLSDVANVYNMIAQARKPAKTEEDINLEAIFKAQLQLVQQELSAKLTRSLSDDIKKAMVLKAKHVLVSFAFSKMVNIYSAKRAEDIWRSINGIYEEVFDGFAELLIEVISRKRSKETNGGAVEELEERLKEEKRKRGKVYTENDELIMQINSLQEENKKYLDKILKSSKNMLSNSFIVNSVSIIPARCESNSSNSSNSSLPNNRRNSSHEGKQTVPLQQLKELVDDIYIQKAKFDSTCTSAKQLKPTMEQYLYVYFKRKYNKKTHIIEWVNLLISSVRRYAKDDSDIALFVKILQNRCDEDYRLVHQEVKATIAGILYTNLKKKQTSKNDSVEKMLRSVQEGNIEEETWRPIVQEMYNEADSNELIAKVKEKTSLKAVPGKKSSAPKIKFNIFLKVTSRST
eukprot:TRINITY_DN11030_c0_g1_i9.p1 TRINITY_DN11030_c0_g1~~TRINITY_DN11030_c0_g1_i9.p1  ORF type:complete len:556 (-),score=154.85 TRINITY_DN11030_c0_g1_i9:427-2094(-)